jgi:hypothetical protein
MQGNEKESGQGETIQGHFQKLFMIQRSQGKLKSILGKGNSKGKPGFFREQK